MLHNEVSREITVQLNNCVIKVSSKLLLRFYGSIIPRNASRFYCSAQKDQKIIIKLLRIKIAEKFSDMSIIKLQEEMMTLCVFILNIARTKKMTMK